VAILTASELGERLSAKVQLRTRTIPCPEIGEGAELLVCRLTGAARVALETAFAAISEGADSKALTKAMIVVLRECVVDESERRILTEQRARQLFDRYPEVAFRVRDTAMELAGMTDDEVADLAQDFG